MAQDNTKTKTQNKVKDPVCGKEINPETSFLEDPTQYAVE